ncbi:MAG: class I SAM-dependent methyltransferase [Methylococcaceae bacterium]|nr:class I SAM-dependent methyltransferase [Methylococcaceae bacterium]
MDRIAEPELMDSPEQAQAYANADFAQPHDRFVQLFREYFDQPELSGLDVLDLGCGPADVTVRFARAHPNTRITGIDAGPNMLALARRAVELAGLTDRIHLIQGHLPGYALHHARFDVVISNSLLHHLADPVHLWEAVQRAGKPGARVFVMDLLRPACATEWDFLVEQYARGEPEVLRRDFRNSLRASYRCDEVEAQLEGAGLGGLAVRAVSDRHWIAAGQLRG